MQNKTMQLNEQLVIQQETKQMYQLSSATHKAKSCSYQFEPSERKEFQTSDYKHREELEESKSFDDLSKEQLLPKIDLKHVIREQAKEQPKSLYTWGPTLDEASEPSIDQKSDYDLRSEACAEVPVFDDTLKEVKFTVLSFGSEHYAAVSEEGQLYTWGRGDDGQLGVTFVAMQVQFQSSPTLVRSIGGRVPILDVACGSSHTLCLDLLGRAHAWGSNE